MAFDLTSPHYNARAFSGGLLTDPPEFAAVRTEAGDGRRLRFDVVFVLKLLPVKFSEAGEVQDARHLRISDRHRGQPL